ncbi:hypothetical protein BCR35DRAFT_308040 [Leucosporidium creatinivorum]|uniref:Uncharacterized protein n=1 Tax=Leucosporidium creatinivorum TaxID=106004 RepID=A0A1Y2ED11_9BASI|nr:hypothetical protein BCR35DRAFT_308040 [Leucosporidium creatinivorum]
MTLPRLLVDAAPTFFATFSSFCFASQATLKTWTAVRELPPPLVSATKSGSFATKPRLRVALVAAIVLVLGAAEVSFLLELLPRSSVVDYGFLFLAGFCVELCIVEFVGDLAYWVRYIPTRLEDGGFEFAVVPGSQGLVATIVTACGAFGLSLSAWMGFQDGRVNLSAIILATAVLSRAITHTSTSLRVISTRGVTYSLGLWTLLMALGGVFTLLNLVDGYGTSPSSFSRRIGGSVLDQAKPYIYHTFSLLCSTVPGVLVAVARRFDDSRQEKSISLVDSPTPQTNLNGLYRSPYFLASIFGWLAAQALGALFLSVAIPFPYDALSTEERQSIVLVARTVLEAPAVVLSCLAFALLRGDLGEFWLYAEEWVLRPVVRREVERAEKSIVVLIDL